MLLLPNFDKRVVENIWIGVVSLNISSLIQLWKRHYQLNVLDSKFRYSHRIVMSIELICYHGDVIAVDDDMII